MRRRVGRPGLIGTMARTAVIAGTATAVSGGVQRNQAQRAAEAGAGSAPAQQTLPSAAPAPAGSNDTVAQLAQLGELLKAGVLDDTEFAAAKAKLLGL